MESNRILYIDAVSGISGDMMIGALLDLGADLASLDEGLDSLHLHGCGLSAEKVQRAGIHATKFGVHIDPNDESEAPGHDHPGDSHHHHRSFAEIRRMIEASHISPWAKQKAVAAFSCLAQAEGKVHSQPPETVHFHEVGALDSIVDIVGCMILIERWMPARILCSPVNVGRGTLVCRHGVYPVPGPAAELLLAGVPTFSNAVDGELTTPTGAALLRVLVEEFGSRPVMRTGSSGYGAGSRDTPGNANVLRLTLGEEASELFGGIAGDVTVIEAAIDDMNPQVWGYFQQRALDAGALDVYATPVQMKKNRPAFQLTVVCEHGRRDDLIRLIFTETTTIGIRHRQELRKTLDRTVAEVITAYGPVGVKVCRLEGRRVNFLPEYEDCRRLAAESGVPLKAVMAEASRAYLEQFRE